MAKSGVYKITNLINNMCYIGSAVYVERRLVEHRNGRNSNPHLQNAIKKYGVDNFSFEVLEYCDKQDTLIREQIYIDRQDHSKLYNISKIAGSGLGLYWSEERKKSKSGKGNHFFGKKHSAEWKEATRKRMLGNKNGKGHHNVDKMLEGMRRYWSNITNRAHASKEKKKYWKDPKNREAASKRTKEQWNKKRSNDNA